MKSFIFSKKSYKLVHKFLEPVVSYTTNFHYESNKIQP